MLFINTRPSERAASLTQALQAAQIDVLEVPLLELVKQPFSNELHGLYQQIQDAQVIVVVSPTAVNIGMEYLSQANLSLSDLKHIQWIAVGQATATCLKKYGIESHVPEVETSEGMLNLPILTALNAGACIAFWRGEGGRLFMMDHLKQLNMRVLNLVLYHRQCPMQASTVIDHHFESLNELSSFSVLITSEASWLNWLSMMKKYPQLIEKAYYLVLGSRLSAIVAAAMQPYKALGWTEIHDLQPETILQQLANVQGIS